MVTKTFLTKCNTIVNSSDENFGLNPICSLNYGKHVSRVLIYFDEEKLKNGVKDGTYRLRDYFTHHLKMKNCGTINIEKFFENEDSKKFLSNKHRASSFDIIAFKIPRNWDAGNGFDKSTDAWFLGYKSVSKDGSTWKKRKNGVEWKEEDTNITNGIYSSDFLWSEYNKWYRNEKGDIIIPKDCIVIGRQHFDYGNENLDIDITDYVNSLLYDDEKNYGICLAFSPKLELTETENDNYINFFTNNTNTFFVPYVESRYNIVTNDDRYKFYLGKENRLYFYSIVNGEFVNLDETPSCEINGVFYNVFSETKGIYYATVKLPKNEKEKAIMTDIWGNIKFNGESFDDVEMEFVTLPYKNHFSFGNELSETKTLNPIVSGINDDAKLNQGEKREVSVVFRVPYTAAEYELVDNCYYRIYVKDADSEIDVVDWDSISTIGKNNVFIINTSELLPQKYHVDIKAVIGRQTLLFKNKLCFEISNNVTEIKQ